MDQMGSFPHSEFPKVHSAEYLLYGVLNGMLLGVMRKGTEIDIGERDR